MKKRLFVFMLVAVMVFSFVAMASADELDDLLAAAKKEGKLVVYSVTSRIHEAAEAFQKLYGIEVEAHRLSEVELVERVYQEARAGVNAVDLVLIEDYPSIKELLIQPGYLTNYVPPVAREAVAPEYHDPLVFAYISRIIGYNTEVYPNDPFDSIWDLTTPEYRGRVMIRDLAITGEHQNAFTELVRRSDELEAEYERRFGEKLVLREENAGLEFLRRLVENDIILMTSDTRIAESVGKKGQENPPFGFYYVYSKHRDIPRLDLALAASTNIKPFLGYYYGMYVQLATKAKHPNAAKLFANYLMTPEGYEPWSSEVGFYSMNKNIEPHPDDMPWEWWKERLWSYDPDFAIANRGKVLDTWIRSVVQ